MLRGTWAASGFMKALSRGYQWIAATLPSLTEDSSGWGGYTSRQHIASAALPSGGNYVRFSIVGGVSQGIAVTNCYIGKKGTGDFDFATTPTQVFFNGGSASCTVAAGATQMCDPVALSFSSSDSLVIAIYTSGASTYKRYGLAAAGNFKNAYKLANDASSVTASGYTNNALTTYSILEDLEVSN